MVRRGIRPCEPFFFACQESNAHPKMGVYRINSGHSKTKIMTTTIRLALLLFIGIISYLPNANAQLDTLFIIGPQEVCAGECAEYFIEGANPDSPYQWLLSNGQQINDFNSFAVICWDEPGIFDVMAFPLQDSVVVLPITVFVEDLGNIAIASISNVQCDSPSGTSTDPCENVCAYTTVTYSIDAISPGGTNVEWEVTGAESYTVDLDQITVEWGGPGQGLIEVFSFGFCTSYGSLCVDILENPQAAFTSTPAANNGTINLCEGQTVFFENESTGASRFTWIYDILGSSDNVNGEFTFEAPGTYEVLLIAQNECFCADTTAVTVEVEDAEPPLIDCVGTVCPGESVTYTTPAVCGTYDWNILGNGTVTDGGGTADDYITVTWNAGPVGWIELTVSGCAGTICAETMVERIPILDGTAQIKGPTEVCFGEEASYQIEKYDGASYIWSVEFPGTFLGNNQQSEVEVGWFGSPFTANNPLELSVEYENCYLECTGMATLEVYLLNEFFVEGPIEVCQNSTTNYVGKNVYFGPMAGWNWVLEDQTGTPVWNSVGSSTSTDVDWNYAAGNYKLVVTPANPTDYCVDEYEIFITIVEPPAQPEAVVGETEICPGTAYRYDAQTISLNNDFVWYVQDGATTTTLTGNPVTYVWGPTPPYSISAAQIATTGLPCESDTTTLEVFPIGTPALSGNPNVCDESTELYTATFFENVNYVWTVTPSNAGSIISGQGTSQAEVQWNSPGNATLQVEVCSQNANLNIQVNALPDPMPIHPDGLCPGETVVVTTSTAYASYSWRDEDGNQISSAPNPDLGPGYYEVVVTDAFGCEGNNSFFMDAYESPTITVSTPDDTGHCLPEPFPTIYALETDGGYDYQWFRDGIPVGTNSSSILATVYGLYWVVVTNAQGCTATSNSVSVFEFCDPIGGGVCNGGTCGLPATDCEPGTNISFTSSPSAFCNTIDFQNTCFDYQVGSLVWTFDDGTSSTDPNPSHTYDRAGYYTVILEGTNNAGEYCWDAEIVLVPAAADFEMEEACAGGLAQFNDLSTYVPAANITNWDWDFGDPASGAANTSPDQNPQHQYMDAGTYLVTLTITEQSGCTSMYQEQVEVRPLPVIEFQEPVVNCEGTSMLFEAQVSSDVIEVEWDFGDPGTGDANFATALNSYHTFDAPGVYTVTLTASNIYGCSQVFTDDVTVDPNGLSGTIQASGPLTFCEGEDVDLTAPAGGVSWAWSTGEISETINTTVEDVYSVTITDAEGCEYTPPAMSTDIIPLPSATIAAVELNEYNQPVNLVYNSYSVCEGTDVTLQVVGEAPYQYGWPTGDFGVSTSYAEWRGNQLAVGTYNIDLNVFDPSTGCSNVANFEVVVHPNPVDVTISASNLPLCENNPATLSVDNPDPMLVYVWNTGEVGTSISVFAAGEYFVKAINSNGCSTLSDPLEVEAGPDIAKIPSGCLTRCNPDTLCLPAFPAGTTFQWFYEGSAIPAPEGTVAELVATQSGVYHVEMVGPTGCPSVSGELVLDLYIGYGAIEGEVYFDLNDNGIVDAGDTLMTGVVIELFEGGTVVNTSTTNNGVYNFNNILALDYTVSVDVNSLPAYSTILVDQADLSLIGCDDEESFVFLVSPDCPPSSSTLNLQACTGTTAAYNGTNIPAGTTQSFNFVNSFGCDSTVTVVVAEVTEDEVELEFSACTGEFIDYNGTMIQAGDEVDFTYLNVAGCDSTVTVKVEELTTSQTTLTMVGCDGNSVNYNGTSLPVGSTTDFQFINYLGCDSTVTVTVNGQTTSVTQVNLEACSGETADYNGMDIPTGATETFVYVDQYGCDSTVIVQVAAYPEILFNLEGTSTCWNSEDGQIEVVDVQGNTAPLSFALEQNGIYQPENSFTDLPAGTYTVFVQDEYGCEYAQDITLLQTERLQVELEDVVFPCDGDRVTLNPFFTQGSISEVEFLWSDGSTEFSLDVTDPGLYWVDISNECEVLRREVLVDWDVETRQEFIYVPNAFSPNNDGINDFFQGFASGDIEIISYELLVFDRWGNLMFKTDSVEEGWDGRMRTEQMNTEVFVYYLNAVVISCGRPREIFKKGDVTLID